MKTKTYVWTLVALTVGLAVPALAQTPEQQMPPEMQEYMEKYATPGEHHKHLEMLAGKWTTMTKFWPAPGAPVQEWAGRAEHRMVLGGRYLETSYESEFMGMAFEGRGTAAYDRYKQKYVETWIDSMGTMVMISEGTCDGTGKTRTVSAAYDDPMSGQSGKLRSVTRILNDDQYVLEMYWQPEGSEEFKMMEIAHTRAH